MLKYAKYLLFTIVIFGYLIFSQYLIEAIRNHDSTYLTMTLPYTMSPIYIILGFILGLEYLICQVIKKDGRLACDLGKLICVGIPALFFSCYSIIVFANLLAFTSLSILNQLLFFKEPFFACSSIILGYTIITSIKRV